VTASRKMLESDISVLKEAKAAYVKRWHVKWGCRSSVCQFAQSLAVDGSCRLHQVFRCAKSGHRHAANRGVHGASELHCVAAALLSGFQPVSTIFLFWLLNPALASSSRALASATLSTP
jgi:hypothetical protein